MGKRLKPCCEDTQAQAARIRLISKQFLFYYKVKGIVSREGGGIFTGILKKWISQPYDLS
jgi:hypothetical protein